MGGLRVRGDVTGIILAGGRSRRLGRNKALESIGGQPLVQRVADRLSQVTDDLSLVVAEPEQGDSLPVSGPHRVVLDLHPGGGSLGGIYSGLSAAKHQWGIVVAYDMPFLNLDLLRRMLQLREGVDAVVPVLQGRPEPTHAVYSKVCLPHMEQSLLSGQLKISGFYDQINVSYVSEDEIASLDPDFLSFFNVNTPDDLEKALVWAEQGK